MLRSIFSLIQRIIDSDKKYNNTKSQAVIYCFTNPDDTVTMDLEIDGKSRRRIMKTLDHRENAAVEPKEKSFSIKTEQGDTVTCKHQMDVDIVPKEKDDRDESNRVTFSNTTDEKIEEDINRVVDGEVQPNVRDLIEHFPTKRMDLSSKEKDQISSLLEQIQKMKTGLHRLQEIALQFNSSERFTEDINYLINNVRPYLRRQAGKEATDDQNISPKT